MQQNRVRELEARQASRPGLVFNGEPLYRRDDGPRGV